MRQKKLYTIIAFDTTDQAVKSEKILSAGGIKGRIIPLPPEIEAGCGLAYRCPENCGSTAAEILRNNGCAFKSCTDIMMF